MYASPKNVPITLVARRIPQAALKRMNNKTKLRLSRPARIALGYVLAAALWILLSDGLVAALVPDHETHLVVQSGKGLGFVLVTALVLYVLLRTPAPEDAPSAPYGPDRTGAALLGLTFMLLAGLIAGAGLLAYRHQAATFKAQQHSQQAAIAELKAGQIERWVGWRRQQAELLRNDADLAESARRLLSGASPAASRHVRGHFETLLATGGWTAIGLYAADGRPLLLAGQADGPSPALRDAIMAAAAAGTFRLNDIHADDIHADDAAAPAFRIDFLAPLAGHPAVLALSADPRVSLFQMAQSWPIPSDSSEALLARQEGEVVVYLTPPRHSGAKPLEIRRPLSDMRLAASQAVRRGDGVLEGRDYRGTEVLAAFRQVPGTDWHIVAKTDTEEVLRPLRRQAGQILAMVMLSIGLCGVFVAYLWRSRQAAYARRMRRSEAEREAMARKLEALFQQARDIILLVAPDGRIVEANEAALAAYGYSAEEIRALSIRDLRAADIPDDPDNQFEAAEGPGGIQFETSHRRKDGSVFPVEVSSRVIEIDGQRFRQSFVRDISERRRTEATVRGQFDELRRWYAATLEREGRVAELKAEVNALRARLGEPPRYASPAPSPPAE